MRSGLAPVPPTSSVGADAVFAWEKTTVTLAPARSSSEPDARVAAFAAVAASVSHVAMSILVLESVVALSVAASAEALALSALSCAELAALAAAPTSVRSLSPLPTTPVTTGWPSTTVTITVSPARTSVVVSIWMDGPAPSEAYVTPLSETSTLPFAESPAALP